jgi:hypothetical protein
MALQNTLFCTHETDTFLWLSLFGNVTIERDLIVEEKFTKIYIDQESE